MLADVGENWLRNGSSGRFAITGPGLGTAIAARSGHNGKATTVTCLTTRIGREACAAVNDK
jgi:hypothetical protein